MTVLMISRHILQVDLPSAVSPQVRNKHKSLFVDNVIEYVERLNGTSKKK